MTGHKSYGKNRIHKIKTKKHKQHIECCTCDTHSIMLWPGKNQTTSFTSSTFSFFIIVALTRNSANVLEHIKSTEEEAV